MIYYSFILDRKARFARDRAARGWRVAYQATPMDLTNQSHTLDPALKASRARRIAPIRLLKKDYSFTFLSKVHFALQLIRCVLVNKLASIQPDAFSYKCLLKSQLKPSDTLQPPRVKEVCIAYQSLTNCSAGFFQRHSQNDRREIRLPYETLAASASILLLNS